MSRRVAPRKAFILLAVLWMLTAVSALVISVELLARDGLAASRNRQSLTRTIWIAEGCAALVRNAISDSIRAGIQSDGIWSRVDTALAGLRLLDGCEVRAIPAGVTVDVNTVGARQLAATLRAVGVPSAGADSLAALIADFRTSEISDIAELPLLSPEYASLAGIDSILGVEPGRILLARAPLAVIAGLPGIGPEALRVIAARRLTSEPVRDLDSLVTQLSPRAREALLEHYGELVSLTTNVPDAWIVTCRARTGTPPVITELELRLVRSGRSVGVVRRRSTP